MQVGYSQKRRVRARANPSALAEWLTATFSGATAKLQRPHARNGVAARDITQETWMGIVNGIARLDDPARFQPRACRIVANKAPKRPASGSPGCGKEMGAHAQYPRFGLQIS